MLVVLLAQEAMEYIPRLSIFHLSKGKYKQYFCLSLSFNVSFHIRLMPEVKTIIRVLMKRLHSPQSHHQAHASLSDWTIYILAISPPSNLFIKIPGKHKSAKAKQIRQTSSV